jgi:hypothetical protein
VTGALDSILNQASPEWLVIQHPLESGRNRIRFFRIHIASSFFSHFAVGGNIRSNDRQPTSHGLEQGESESFPYGRRRKSPCSVVNGRQIAGRDIAQLSDPTTQSGLLDGRIHRRLVYTWTARQ